MSIKRECNLCHIEYMVFDVDAGTHKEFYCSENCADNAEQEAETISSAIYTAMWPNQPVNVCEKHAHQIINIGAAMGLRVPLRPYVGDDECINCKNEAKRRANIALTRRKFEIKKTALEWLIVNNNKYQLSDIPQHKIETIWDAAIDNNIDGGTQPKDSKITPETSSQVDAVIRRMSKYLANKIGTCPHDAEDWEHPNECGLICHLYAERIYECWELYFK